MPTFIPLDSVTVTETGADTIRPVFLVIAAETSTGTVDGTLGIKMFEDMLGSSQ